MINLEIVKCPCSAAFAHVYRIKNGRIVRFQQYTDTLKVAEATQPMDKTIEPFQRMEKRRP